ncbi:hypothetical protein [Dactylosporangium sp. NPDC049140]|uniref:hypothetical protein n=1 Tax=Dactylosporangium sp. NPDC049140 TaxID=3155647 RepID=UPI0033F878F8
MEVNEVAIRLVRRYWAVLLPAVLVPVLLMAGYVTHEPEQYTARGRVVAAATVPRSVAEAAAVVSQVQAIATSPGVVRRVLDAAHLPRDPFAVVDAVTVTGLGSSAVVEIAYTDGDAAMAQKVAAALVTAVAGQLDALRVGALPDTVQDLSRQLTDLAEKRAPIAAQAQAKPQDPVAQNHLASMDRLIADLTADRDRLSEEAASAGRSAVVDAPAVPARPDPSGLPGRLAIAAFAGLALGLILAGLNEIARPRVSGATQVGRALRAPGLGRLNADPAVLADLGRRIRLAAGLANVSTVVLARPGGAPIGPELVDRVEAAALRPAAVPARVAIPVQAAAVEALAAGPAGAEPSGDSADSGDGTGRTARLQGVCALDELDPGAEGGRIGVVVLAGGHVRTRAVDRIRDLAAASGWHLLGVVEDGGAR